MIDSKDNPRCTVYSFSPTRYLIGKQHLCNRQILTAPSITAKARLLGRRQPEHQMTITVSYSREL